MKKGFKWWQSTRRCLIMVDDDRREGKRRISEEERAFIELMTLRFSLMFFEAKGRKA